MSKKYNNEDIVGIEARHAVYCKPERGERDDLHVVKEIIHFKDGTTKTNMRPYLNFKRPFWITQPGFRNHKEKKEWEKIHKLQRYECTQSDLTFRIANALERGFGGGGSLRQLCRSPYVYGADIKSTALLMKKYQERCPDLVTPSRIAGFDIESDVNKGTEDILMATLSFGSKIVTAVTKEFLHGHANATARLQSAFDRYMGEEKKDRKIDWEVVIVDTQVDVIRHVFKRAHEWQPDIITIWNINYDLPKILKVLEKEGIDPKDIFCDPNIPEKFKFFRYKEGRNKLITASGKVKPKKWVEQWHTVFCPASFYFIDGACAYKAIRTGQGDEPRYGLDAIMNKHLERGKMKLAEADHLEGLEWHQFMQEHYPFEYTVYNVFDCVGMELLDEKINDLRLTLPMMAGSSDYEDFSSQPRCSADNLHYFALSKNKVMGTTSDDMTHELDKHCVTREGWICTLPAHLIAANGLRVLEDYPDLQGNIYSHVGDLDVKAAYPNAGVVMNVSKDTTVRELVKIEGIDLETQREIGINLSAGHVNAVEICCNVFKFPSMVDLLEGFCEDEGIVIDSVIREVQEIVYETA